MTFPFTYSDAGRDPGVTLCHGDGPSDARSMASFEFLHCKSIEISKSCFGSYVPTVLISMSH